MYALHTFSITYTYTYMLKAMNLPAKGKLFERILHFEVKKMSKL